VRPRLSQHRAEVTGDGVVDIIGVPVDGIAAARRRQADGRMLPGKKHIGRPAVTGPAELAALQGLIADGKSVTEAARTLKIGRSTAYAALAATRA
jgi:DNA invertase Pin-like site-specific DNA recombinase